MGYILYAPLIPQVTWYLPDQDCIPTLRGDKTSRAQVLKKTGDYIVHMQKKISNHQDEIKELKNQNTQLEMQIRTLEKAKATGGFVGGDLLEVNIVPFWTHIVKWGIPSKMPSQTAFNSTKDDLAPWCFTWDGSDMRLDHAPGGVRNFFWSLLGQGIHGADYVYGATNSQQVESLVTQNDLELDNIDSQEIVYDDNSSDNSDCQVNTLLDCPNQE